MLAQLFEICDNLARLTLNWPPYRRRSSAAAGFRQPVVARERLEDETMALAREIAKHDRFTLRMAKWAANSAQDAIRFGNSIRNAHAHCMVHGLGSYIKDKLEGKNFPKDTRRHASLETARQ